MTFFHTFFAKGYSNGNCCLEIVDLSFDYLCNFKHIVLFLVSECYDDLIDEFKAIVKGIFELNCIKFFPWVVHP